MLHAVAGRKATSYLTKVEETIRHPLEDMITSTVFGPLDLMPSDVSAQGLSWILGLDREEIFLSEIRSFKFWPRYKRDGKEDGKVIEPDLVVSCQSAAQKSLELWLEIKWNSPFKADQIVDQSRISAPGREARSIAVVRNGADARISWAKHGPTCKLAIVTWSEVATNARKAMSQTDQPWLKRWLDLVRRFLLELHEVPFSGFDSLRLLLDKAGARWLNYSISSPMLFQGGEKVDEHPPGKTASSWTGHLRMNSMAPGAAIYHAARILAAASDEVSSLKEVTVKQLSDKLGGIGISVEDVSEGTGKFKQDRPFSQVVAARWFNISLKSGASDSVPTKGTLVLVFDFGTPDGPSETLGESLVFVCWLAARKPDTVNDYWSNLSFVKDELTNFKRYPDGLCFQVYDAAPNDASILTQDWVYALRLSSLRTDEEIRRLIVDPVVTILSGSSPAQGLDALRDSLVCFAEH